MDGLERYHKLLRLLVEEAVNGRVNELRQEVYQNFQLLPLIDDPDDNLLATPDGDFILAL